MVTLIKRRIKAKPNIVDFRGTFVEHRLQIKFGLLLFQTDKDCVVHYHSILHRLHQLIFTFMPKFVCIYVFIFVDYCSRDYVYKIETCNNIS